MGISDIYESLLCFTVVRDYEFGIARLVVDDHGQYSWWTILTVYEDTYHHTDDCVFLVRYMMVISAMGEHDVWKWSLMVDDDEDNDELSSVGKESLFIVQFNKLMVHNPAVYAS